MTAVPVTAVAESLLIFLSYTKDPIIPYHLHDACIAAATNFQHCRQVGTQNLSKMSNCQLQDGRLRTPLLVCMYLGGHFDFTI